MNNENFSYEVIESLGTLSTNPKTNWSKEVKIISWNGRPKKLDIRDWYTDEDGNTKMSKGISLNEDEVKKLREILDNLDLD